ncbi:hypothetical protein [Corynebacterium callunae]|uniref:DUF3168 domain-containing protein n=1 Tax=Corynebacterium callunae DSM 20147 TaxID=1121353 RepID=M1UUB9_9CORY|nr:hypothetical protein [Corynebacterium callunae]AGG66877.1 hypothetical protein H924_07175 [Corynebacterium callunae DSM 20147]
MIVPPSAQLVAVQALSQALSPVLVSTKIPTQNRPAEHIVVSRIGSSSPEFGTSMPRFLIEVYGATELATERLAEKVQQVWLELRTHGVNFTTSDFNLQPFEAPDTSHVRYQFTGGLQIIL